MDRVRFRFLTGDQALGKERGLLNFEPAKWSPDMTASFENTSRLLNTAEAASMLGLKPCTLASWREYGSQPDLVFFKLGKAVRYRLVDIESFLAKRQACNTVIARRIDLETRIPRRAKHPASG